MRPAESPAVRRPRGGCAPPEPATPRPTPGTASSGRRRSLGSRPHGSEGSSFLLFDAGVDAHPRRVLREAAEHLVVIEYGVIRTPQLAVDAGHELQILRRIDGPAVLAPVTLGLHAPQPESAALLIDVWR